MEYKSYKDRKMALPNLRYFVDSCESQLANLLDSLKGADPMKTTSVERWEERLFGRERLMSFGMIFWKRR